MSPGQVVCFYLQLKDSLSGVGVTKIFERHIDHSRIAPREPGNASEACLDPRLSSSSRGSASQAYPLVSGHLGTQPGGMIPDHKWRGMEQGLRDWVRVAETSAHSAHLLPHTGLKLA